jgi:hypothetical protein
MVPDQRPKRPIGQFADSQLGCGVVSARSTHHHAKNNHDLYLEKQTS